MDRIICKTYSKTKFLASYIIDYCPIDMFINPRALLRFQAQFYFADWELALEKN